LPAYGQKRLSDDKYLAFFYYNVNRDRLSIGVDYLSNDVDALNLVRKTYMYIYNVEPVPKREPLKNLKLLANLA
jgi:hypothetical protein